MSETGEKANGAVFCRGESMQPLFRPGDRILFAPCRMEEMRRGDVIIFLPPGAKSCCSGSCKERNNYLVRLDTRAVLSAGAGRGGS